MRSEDEERLERLKAIVRALPEKPGSYQYYDAEGIIIYVGKAKNLKARVSSYFHTEVDRFKTKVLVSKIHDISYTVVNTEEDALLLENALIKKYNPRYNVLLKDGKTYVFVSLKNTCPVSSLPEQSTRNGVLIMVPTRMLAVCMPYWNSSTNSTNHGSVNNPLQKKE